MLSPLEWKEYGESFVTKIPELKGFIKVKEESHLVKRLKNFNDFPVLVFVDLSSGTEGANADAAYEKHAALTFVLTKAIDPKNSSEAKELEADMLTHGISEQFKKILRSKKDAAGKPCSYMHRLDYSSIITDPVYNYNGCNGWSVVFEF